MKTLTTKNSRNPPPPPATRAFTLIELLVVVLIIGILAAVALPQYNKAVERSRVAQMHTTMRALYNAQKAYQMENDTYTWDLTELPLDFPGYTFTSYLGFTNSVLKNNDFLVAFNYPNTPDKTFIYGVPTRGCQSSTQLRAFNNSCYVLTLDMINGNITCADGTKEPVKMSCKTIGY